MRRLLPVLLLLVGCGVPQKDAAPAVPSVTVSVPKPAYAINEHFSFSVSVGPVSGYLYVFHVDADGVVDQILPNQNRDAAPVYASQVYAFPPPDAKFTFDISAPFGPSTVLALFSTLPINLSEISEYPSPSSLFPATKISGAETLSAALKRAGQAVEKNRFVEDRATYTVVLR